jgi:hypothetical protein
VTRKNDVAAWLASYTDNADTDALTGLLRLLSNLITEEAQRG